MTSRYLSLRPDNVQPDAKISFKAGFPVLTFTIQSQAAILDPRSIRINGELMIYKDNASPPTPVFTNDASPKIQMDNRLGIFALWDQLVIRHNKSKQICEHIRHYNKYLSSYLALTSSRQDMMGHLNEACLIQPNKEAMFSNVVASSTSVQAEEVPKHFSTHLPSGFIMSGNSINLLENSFGGIQIEIHLSPDSNCLFNDTGVVGANPDAHYELKNLSLTCEVFDIPAAELATAQAETSGALEFNTISSLYTSINTSNAQLQYNLGLKNLQSCFVTFTPSDHINTLTENGLATTYPSQDDGKLVQFSRIQWLKGGRKYPVDFDMLSNGRATFPLNADDATAGATGKFAVSDSQLAKQFADAIIPEGMLDRSSLSPLNLNRIYDLVGTTQVDEYKQAPDGGVAFGLGMRYSQFNKGQDYSSEQWGLSLESDLTTDSPQSVFMFFKAKAVLAWDGASVQMMT